MSRIPALEAVAFLFAAAVTTVSAFAYIPTAFAA